MHGIAVRRSGIQEPMAIERFEIDVVHSSVLFAVRHLLVSRVHGRFTRWEGVLMIDEEELSRSTVEVRIDASSIDTGVVQRDSHLRSSDFLAAADFPELNFVSHRIEPMGDGRVRVVGTLTLRGVSRELIVDVERIGRTIDFEGNPRIGFHASTAIDRSEYGLTWNQAVQSGGILVGERVEIEAEIEAVKVTSGRRAA